MMKTQAAMRHPFQGALAHQGLDIILGRAVAGEAECFGNLAQGWCTSALGHVLADMLQHAALIVGQLEFVHTY